LILRLYVCYDLSKRVLLLAVILGLIMTSVSLILSTAPLEFKSGFTRGLAGCPFAGSRSSALPYIPLLFFESALATLMIARRCSYRGPISCFLAQLYNDGLLYMAVIITITAVNIVIGLSLPLEYSNMLETLLCMVSYPVEFCFVCRRVGEDALTSS